MEANGGLYFSINRITSLLNITIQMFLVTKVLISGYNYDYIGSMTTFLIF
jgi:hypothetical protein